jgi:hypothetical protein
MSTLFKDFRLPPVGEELRPSQQLQISQMQREILSPFSQKAFHFSPFVAIEVVLKQFFSQNECFLLSSFYVSLFYDKAPLWHQ